MLRNVWKKQPSEGQKEGSLAGEKQSKCKKLIISKGERHTYTWRLEVIVKKDKRVG